MRPKIAFFKVGSFSHINRNVAPILASNFPEYDVETMDVGRLLRMHPHLALGNAPAMIRHYGRDLLTLRRSVGDCFYRTPYLFAAIRRLANTQLGPRRGAYRFTFQMQSLWDASTGDLPHFIYTDHTHLANLSYPGFDPAMLLAPAWVECERQMYHRATKVFTMSHHVERSLLEQYGCAREQVACVFAGSNAEPVALQNDNYSNKQIVFVGVAWERKGGPELVEAFRLVLKQHPDAHLTIIGCAPRVSLPNCTVAGLVPLEKVREFYGRASIFCLPTRLEPFGIVFVEALRNRLPIVASNLGALPDMVQDGATGRLVPPGDVPALASALIELLNDPEQCRRLGEQGHRLAQEQYCWEAVGRRLRSEIDECLAARTT
jgi:glycosyltransferase involved in cell wall biosynthesis